MEHYLPCIRENSSSICSDERTRPEFERLGYNVVQFTPIAKRQWTDVFLGEALAVHFS